MLLARYTSSVNCTSKPLEKHQALQRHYLDEEHLIFDDLSSPFEYVTIHISISIVRSLIFSDDIVLFRPTRHKLFGLRCHGHSLLLFSYTEEPFTPLKFEQPQQILNHLVFKCLCFCNFQEDNFSSLFESLVLVLGVWSDCWVYAPVSLGRSRTASNKPPINSRYIETEQDHVSHIF